MSLKYWTCCGVLRGDTHRIGCKRTSTDYPEHQTIGKPIRDEHGACLYCGYSTGHADECFYAPVGARTNPALRARPPRPLDVRITSHSPELTKPADGPKTLLDEIAIAAMQGMLAASGKTGTAQMTTNEISQHAYYQAKSMLAARARFGK